MTGAVVPKTKFSWHLFEFVLCSKEKGKQETPLSSQLCLFFSSRLHITAAYMCINGQKCLWQDHVVEHVVVQGKNDWNCEM